MFFVGERVCCKDGALNIREAKYPPIYQLMKACLLQAVAKKHYWDQNK